MSQITFLDPLVNELLHLWEGIPISGPLSSSFTVRAALLCFVSDIPATRKVFQGQSQIGMFKVFPCEGFGEHTHYSGHDRPICVVRTKEQHLNSLAAIEKATSPSERQELQQRLGVSLSVLCQLPYFNIVRSHLIDPMHMVKIWKDKGIIKQEHLTVIQAKIDALNVPYDVGRIPYKVGSNFAEMTVDQWMNLYSLHALSDVIPPQHTTLGLLVTVCTSICSTTAVHNFTG